MSPIDPCRPHSLATLRAWGIWGRAHRWWHAPKYGPCVKAGALALPLLIGPAVPSGAYPYPGMGGFPTGGATEGYAPAFGEAFGPVGAWVPQAVGFPLPLAPVSAGPGPTEVGGSPLLSGPTATGGIPVTHVDTPPTVETAGPGAAERPVNTPEPSSLEVLVAGLAAWIIGIALRGLRRGGLL